MPKALAVTPPAAARTTLMGATHHPPAGAELFALAQGGAQGGGPGATAWALLRCYKELGERWGQ